VVEPLESPSLLPLRPGRCTGAKRHEERLRSSKALSSNPAGVRYVGARFPVVPPRLISTTLSETAEKVGSEAFFGFGLPSVLWRAKCRPSMLWPLFLKRDFFSSLFQREKQESLNAKNLGNDKFFEAQAALNCRSHPPSLCPVRKKLSHPLQFLTGISAWGNEARRVCADETAGV